MSLAKSLSQNQPGGIQRPEKLARPSSFGTCSKHEVAQTLSMHRRSLTRRLLCDSSLPPDLIDALWDGQADQLIVSATPLQAKDRCIVVRYNYGQGDHGQGCLVIKRHIWGTVSRTARMLLREPVARRCAARAEFLIQHGIPTPRPRACLEHGLGPFSHRSYLLTDYVEGTSLFHCIRSHSLSTDVARHLACQVAVIWQQFIALNISHNDLKTENFIVDSALRVWVIDLEKMRFHRDEAQLRRRHLEDARIFFHVRNWRDHPEAAEIFRSELLKTSLGKWLADSQNATLRSLCQGYTPNGIDQRISVAIVANDRSAEPQQLARTIESVRDMADEIILVGPSASDGQFEVREIIQPNNLEPVPLPRPNPLPARPLQHPWVLVLYAGECATPDLVRQLPERIVDHVDCDAVRIPIDEFLFGQSTRRYCHAKTAPIRLFHRDRCRFSLQDGSLTVAADPSRLLISEARIRHYVATGLDDYVKRLNQQTTRSATVLFRQGRCPHLLTGFARATKQFLREYFLQGRFRSGRVGLQMALLGAMFAWIEQTKLRQFHASTRTMHETIDETLDGPTDALGRDRTISDTPKPKAA